MIQKASEKFPVSVLYVEDEEGIRIPTVEIMKRWVDNLFVAQNGEEGLKIFHNEHPDLIITDLKMPKMGGLEMIREIKSFDKNIRTIVVSAHSDAEYFIEAIQIGVEGFLLKPVLREKLYDALARQCQIILSHKNARFQEEKFITLADSLNEAIMIVNEAGKVIFWNKAASEIFGIKAEQALGMPYHFILQNDSFLEQWAEDESHLSILLGKENIQRQIFEVNCVRTNGENFTAEVSLSGLKDGNAVYTIIILRDVSQRKSYEKNLIEAREKAEEAMHAKQQFLSVMTHEIRTPLHGILGAIELLATENPRPDQADYLKTIEFSGNYLLSLVNDILDFSKIEANKIQFEHVGMEVREIVENLLNLFSFKAQDKGIILNAEFDPLLPDYVLGDPVRLNQILNNLIGNAIKFTDRGSVKVKVSVLTRRNHQIECLFEVIDTGIGIPSDKTKEIFNLFTQADSNTTRRFGGTGLGLAISRKLVELQGGTMGVESHLDEGSRFYFTLSFEESTADAISYESKADHFELLTNVKILLVEDNKINQMIALKFLSRWQAEVDVALNGREALDFVNQKEYNIILMDLQMPEMDGYQTSMAIRNMAGEYYQKVPIIALTASTFAEVRNNILKCGMNDVINKPFIPAELNRKIYYYARVLKQ
jgi:PAS domain S-box-containing protein